MEWFEEIYGSYFQAVRKILLEAGKAPITIKEMEEICRRYASPESALAIVPKLTKGTWSPLLEEQEKHLFSSALRRPENLSADGFLKVPLTKMQKSWLKALLPDPRFRLFFREKDFDALKEELSEQEPLFHKDDFYYFDRFADGDPYEAPWYITNFQTVLKAMICKCPVFLAYQSGKGTERTLELLPCRLQYSPKDDKFRLLGVSQSKGKLCAPYILNLARIRACRLSRNPVPAGFDWDFSKFQKEAAEPVRIRISRERNALERCMLHFANYEKQTVYEPETDTWLCSIYCDPADETELLIELLSFGPVIRILGPDAFLSQVRERVRRQHALFYDPETP